MSESGGMPPSEYPGEPTYEPMPTQVWDPAAYPYDPPPAPPRTSRLTGLGDRVSRRPEARLTVSLAGAGMALAILGVLLWSGTTIGEDVSDGGSGSAGRALGALLSLAVIVLGLGVAYMRGTGPLCTAGVVASALGVPVLLGLLTLDTSPDGESFALPINLDIVALLSIVAWIAAYLLAPGARGHTVFVGLSTATLWIWLIETIEEGTIFFLFLFGWFQGFFAFGDEDFLFPGPDPSNVGGLSLTLGIVYYVGAVILDRTGRSGTATGLLASGFAATTVGITTLAGNLEEIGTGLILVLIGTLLAAYGAMTPGRRFTTWAGAGAVGLGILLIIAKVTDDDAKVGGMMLVIAGLTVVAIAEGIRVLLNEPDDMTPGGSTYRRRVPPEAQPAYSDYPPPPVDDAPLVVDAPPETDSPWRKPETPTD